MIYQHVCVENFTHLLPDEEITTDQIEQRLEPVYQRLKLPAGRLELMTGIRSRRWWPRGTGIGEISIQTVNKAIAASGIDVSHFGALIHGSVCRDYMEPATAAGVHLGAGLPADCLIFDVSNACLGILNGVILLANMIELGQIKAGVVVGTENGRSLLETTIQCMNTDLSLTRQTVKNFFASLTIGSASAAVVLTHDSISRTGNRLLGGAYLAATAGSALCRSDDSVQEGDFMRTDSENLLKQGCEAAARCFPRFLQNLGWTRESFQRVFCHQVGKAHKKLLFDTLQLNPELDYSTMEFLGNTGSAALPSAAALGVEANAVEKNSNVALLGIGSGINVMMLGIHWN